MPQRRSRRQPRHPIQRADDHERRLVLPPLRGRLFSVDFVKKYQNWIGGVVTLSSWMAQVGVGRWADCFPSPPHQLGITVFDIIACVLANPSLTTIMTVFCPPLPSSRVGHLCGCRPSLLFWRLVCPQLGLECWMDIEFSDWEGQRSHLHALLYCDLYGVIASFYWN